MNIERAESMRVKFCPMCGKLHAECRCMCSPLCGHVTALQQLAERYREALSEALTHLHWLCDGGEFAYEMQSAVMCLGAIKEWQEARAFLKTALAAERAARGARAKPGEER